MDNYSQLLAFIWSTECGSFSAAARVHKITPSAVSKLISRLEDRLQVRLFQRGSRVLTLTEEGRRLHAEIAPLALAYEAALICGLAPAEVAQLKRLLTRLQHAAGALAGGAPPLADPGLIGR